MRCENGSTFRSSSIATTMIALVLSPLALTILGCGSDLAQVSGVVTLDGEPLRGGDGIRGTVYFQPTSGAGAAAVGILDENGRFSLSSGSQEGVAPGEYFVTCSATQIIPAENSGGTPSGRRITDPKYASAQTSGLMFTVAPGANEFNIPLESAPASSQRRGG